MNHTNTKQKEIVLEEDEWISAIEGIIERDFFPKGEGVVDLEEKLRTGRATGTYATSSSGSKIGHDEIVKQGLTLDQFLSRYTSEDNASFRAILDASNARRKEKMAHLLPPPPPKDYTKEQHKYAPMNLLMYDGSTRTSLPLSQNEVPSQQRLKSAATKALGRQGVNHKATSLPHEATSLASELHDNIVEDIHKGYRKEKNHTKEYSIMETPRFEPGEDATPIMTWGKIDATPQRIEADEDATYNTKHGGFSIQQTPQREQLAYTMGKHASTALESRKYKKSKVASMLQTHASQGAPMSPAARRLASTMIQRKGADSQLKASYSSHSRRITKKSRSSSWNED